MNWPVLVVIAILLILGFIRETKMFAMPIDCMPRPIIEGDTTKYPEDSLYAKIFGTKCATY